MSEREQVEWAAESARQMILDHTAEVRADAVRLPEVYGDYFSRLATQWAAIRGWLATADSTPDAVLAAEVRAILTAVKEPAADLRAAAITAAPTGTQVAP